MNTFNTSHTEISEALSKLHLSAKYSDITFLISGEKIHAHKVILASRSTKFEELFKENTSEIKLQLEDNKAFKIFLRYIYTGEIFYDSENLESLLSLLRLAHEYSVKSLEKSLIYHLESILNIKNIVKILNIANNLKIDELKSTCAHYFDLHAQEIFNTDLFLEISEEAIIDIIKRDSLFIDELKIFNAIVKWCKGDKTRAKNVVQYLRLTLIDPRDITRIIRPTNIIDSDVLLNALDTILSGKNLEKAREKLIYDVNFARTNKGARVIIGENREFLLSEAKISAGFTYHQIPQIGDGDESHINGIVIELKEIYIINNIKMQLDDSNKNFDFKYYIELSVDRNKWFKVIDYRKYRCRSWQNLYFERQAAKFINIVGICSWSSNKQFRLVEFEVYLREFLPKICRNDAIIYPEFNVANLSNNAIAWKKKQNVCLDGNYKNYDSNIGFASSKLNDEEITVQFAQPYIVSSLKFLLHDKDDRCYSYYIESDDGDENFKILIDKRNEKCKSWQVFQFDECAINILRFIGTYSSKTNSLDIVHIECPILNPVEDKVRSELNEIKSQEEASSFKFEVGFENEMPFLYRIEL